MLSGQPPLILTLQIDQQAFTFFNDLRKKHFPPPVNYLAAHITLFHHLPNIPAVMQALETAAAIQPAISLEVTKVMKLGRGTAYKLTNPALFKLQSNFKQQWQSWLTPQDRQGFNPHITVQNKVDAETATILYHALAQDFQPFQVQAIGLSLWEYRGGPWFKIRDFPFLPASAKG